MQVRACKYEARVQVAACFCNDLLRLVIGFELAKGKDTGQTVVSVDVSVGALCS